MIIIKNDKLIRISKAAAEKLYNDGKPVYMLPCKCRLDNMWIQPYKAEAEKVIYTPLHNDGFNAVVPRNYNFDTVVNCYTYYNCNNELGRYPAFYKEKE